MRSVFLACTLVLHTPLVLAQQADPCQTQMNTVEINACAKMTLAEKDKALNAAYQALVKSLVAKDKSDTTNYPQIRKQLAEAQRNWIKFRDNDCKAKLGFNEGGSIRGAVHLGCLTERTEQRTNELENWVDG